MPLNRTPRTTVEADAIFERLAVLVDDADPGQAPALLARLALILAQHVGDPDVVEEAVRLARTPSEGR